ncbi:restriction endonuclease subunit S [Glaesserella parasuis]|uniref:restriction endonuclease subunit S n=1 Tax=Glaesserella parasuis TaxID=738 RepID=UPI001F1F9712|nr:restriction endonuclease subunit S [Glaesserella parasuis]MDG6345336.1 restriction endonuclease subunit S [Glaesserella parasuis]MDG6771033.1 restriction endonuclease subunit S [Glaesserella parasuis]MDO9831048.1 restriction endonuclease subunit S [Glaesserella parasuis]MDO9873257.1 restriction endonuclease subunit S [Glaesserella parasuis]MDO9913077.1 restriction endonuclease subunit S [Glaesserella parasuis]
MGSGKYPEKTRPNRRTLGKIEAHLTQELQQVKWAEYSCSELFQVVSGSKIKNKSELPEIGNYPVYSSDNNGVVGYTDMPTYICDESRKFYVVFGDHTRTFNIATKSFSILDNVKVLKPLQRVSLRQLLFIISSWKKEIPDLGYARHWKIAKEVKLSLPIKPNANSDKLAQIDFDFMENFISQLEAFRLSQLEAYLLVTGLKDYTLTAAEQQALADFENGKVVWGGYRFADIFNKIQQGRRLKKDDQVAGDIPFVMAGITNTGVVNYISNPVASFPKNSITIDIFGNAFYRSYDFGAGDDTGVYWNDKKELSKEMMLFLTKSAEKALEGKFSYGKKLRSSQSLNFKMQLPTSNQQPDYSFMEILISAVQKLVIKDVVRYADSKIAATKQVING